LNANQQVTVRPNATTFAGPVTLLLRLGSQWRDILGEPSYYREYIGAMGHDQKELNAPAVVLNKAFSGMSVRAGRLPSEE
jgi:hypothetical protein